MNRAARITAADKRYSVRQEFTGQPRPVYVARFCGNWIGWAPTKAEAQSLCVEHKAARESAA